MSNTNICTCPSGDGSLRWPCPVHPALPKPAYPAQFNGHGGEQSSHDGYSATQVLDYAAQTVAAQLSGNEHKALAALRYYRDECTGHEVSQSVFEKMVDEALAAAQAPADPMDWPLPCDVSVGSVTICKGVRLRTLVTRMEVLHKMATAQAEVQAQPVALPGDLIKSVDAWFAKNTGLGGCSDNDVAELAAIFTAHQALPADALNATELLTRYCPGCGHVGPVEAQFRDCCPDGNQARMIPEALAKKCHDTFKLAITSVLDVQTALRDYHYALDTRQHGGVAADNAIKAIQRAFDMPWIQGQEAAARAGTAGKGQTHG
ncbi:hypothetical protein [Comamonas odontotermitis]|uniref:hypothetical protein n=1 Tax=Comamonas odontotermitis TaxID=379895 RepID=UPI001CC334DD|nr:hypothetical protein [Comamonas odontotermitis]UBB19525.1 hypothetical protein LAD35_22230 [Comamonas odontotermitis]